jgi:hypothetical protein
MFRHAREDRDSWLNWPAQVAALIAAERVGAHAVPLGYPFGSPQIAGFGDISVPGQDRMDNLVKVHC